MAEPTSFPTMFGRYTAILSEHRELGPMLHALGDLCAALEAHDPRSPPERGPVQLIGEFVSELSQHFAAEEADEYFGTMARERPGLASAIARLEADHRAMLETLRALLEASADERKWRMVARSV